MNDTNTYTSKDNHGRQILTVGQLKNVLALFDDTAHVIIYDNAASETFNVGELEWDATHEARNYLELHLGDPVDTIQF
jgi:hypothetical protein